MPSVHVARRVYTCILLTHTLTFACYLDRLGIWHVVVRLFYIYWKEIVWNKKICQPLACTYLERSVVARISRVQFSHGTYLKGSVQSLHVSQGFSRGMYPKGSITVRLSRVQWQHVSQGFNHGTSLKGSVTARISRVQSRHVSQGFSDSTYLKGSVIVRYLGFIWE